MTLDDLEKIYSKAWAESGSHRAGIRAVVEALRDKFKWEAHFRETTALFNDILGDAGEKAAGGPAREGGQASQPGSTTPAADPSPARCEWRMVGKTFATAGCEDEYLWSHEYKVCPSCGKPITFQEK